jgi:DNA-directed RNA polymerase specialized sigma24 family protein
LKYLGGFRYRDLGELLDLPSGHGHERLFNARRALRQKVKQLREDLK